jgi:hypothetical protein
MIYRDYIHPEIIYDGKYISDTVFWKQIGDRVSEKFDQKIAHKLIVSAKSSF